MAKKIYDNVDFKKILGGKGKDKDFKSLRRSLEGPIPLRVISALVGAVMMAAACIGFLNIVALKQTPQIYALQVWHFYLIERYTNDYNKFNVLYYIYLYIRAARKFHIYIYMTFFSILFYIISSGIRVFIRYSNFRDRSKGYR